MSLRAQLALARLGIDELDVADYCAEFRALIRARNLALIGVFNARR